MKTFNLRNLQQWKCHSFVLQSWLLRMIARLQEVHVKSIVLSCSIPRRVESFPLLSQLFDFL